MRHCTIKNEKVITIEVIDHKKLRMFLVQNLKYYLDGGLFD